jgi:hypothetical protein
VFENEAQALLSNKNTNQQFGWNGKEFVATTIGFDAVLSNNHKFVCFEESRNNFRTVEHPEKYDSDWVKVLNIVYCCDQCFAYQPRSGILIRLEAIVDIDFSETIMWIGAKNKFKVLQAGDLSVEEEEALLEQGLMDQFKDLYSLKPKVAMKYAAYRLSVKKKNDSNNEGEPNSGRIRISSSRGNIDCDGIESTTPVKWVFWNKQCE